MPLHTCSGCVLYRPVVFELSPFWEIVFYEHTVMPLILRSHIALYHILMHSWDKIIMKLINKILVTVLKISLIIEDIPNESEQIHLHQL